MADTKISALPAASALAGTEVLPGVQSGATVGVTADQIGDRTASRFGVVKNNATGSDPGSGNDGTQGYAVGSSWFNTSTGVMWRAQSVGTGAAVWTRVAYADHPGYVVGDWYFAEAGTVAAGSTVVAGTARFIPFVPRQSLTVTGLAVRVTTVGTSNVQLAVYASDPTTKRPTGSQLGATGNIANTATTAINDTTVSVALKGGVLYWLAMNCNDSSMICASLPTGQSFMSFLLGSATLANAVSTAPIQGLATPLTFGTWGDVTSATWTEASDNKHALIGFKVGSLP
jgi:hypothetical protein